MVEVERLIVRLVGDAKSFMNMTKQATKAMTTVKTAVTGLQKTLDKSRFGFQQYTNTVAGSMNRLASRVSKSLDKAQFGFFKFTNRVANVMNRLPMTVGKALSRMQFQFFKATNSIANFANLLATNPIQALKKLASAIASAAIGTKLQYAFFKATNAAANFANRIAADPRAAVLALRAATIRLAGVLRGGFVAAMSAAVNHARSLGSAMVAASQRVYKLAVATGSVLKSAMMKAKNAIVSYGLAMKKAVLDRAGAEYAAVTRLSKAFSKLGRDARSAGRRMKAVGRTLSLYVTAPLVAVGGGVVKMSAAFEAEMNKLESLLDINKDQVKKWSEEILDLSGEVGRSPVELAEGMFRTATKLGPTRAQAGGGAESMEILTISAKGAAMQLGETKTVSDLMTSAMNAYETQGLTAARAADILAAAVKEGGLETDQYSKVMGRAIGMASDMGVSLEDLMGQVALLSKTGETGSRAITSIAMLMMNLRKPSQSAREAITGIGLSFEHLQEVAKEDLGLLKVMRLIGDASERYGKDVSAIIPTMRSYRGVLATLSRDTESVNEVMEAVHNSSGRMDEGFADVSKTLTQQFNRAWSGLKAFGIDIGMTVLPMVSNALDKFSKTLGYVRDVWKSLEEPTRKVIIIFTLVAAAIGPVLIGLGLFVGAISLVASAVGAVLSPFGLLIATASVLIAKFVNWGDVLNWFGKQWETLKDLIKPAVDGIKDAIAAKDFKLGVEILWAELKVLYLEGTQELTKIWIEFIAGMKTAWTEGGNKIKNLWEETKTNLAVTMVTVAQLFTPDDGSFDTDAIIGQLEDDLKYVTGKSNDAAKVATDQIASDTAKQLQGVEDSIKHMKTSRDALIEEAAAKAAAIPQTRAPDEAPASVSDKVKYEDPNLPKNIPSLETTGKQFVAPRAATTLGTMEHSQRLAEFRAGQRGGVSPEVKAIDKVKEGIDELVDLQKQELEKGVSAAVNIEPAMLDMVSGIV